jgi:L-ascorbate metabolism protein UlaG (beta-lactamase superfamily)
MSSIWYLGHSGFEIDLGGTLIYIDLYLDNSERRAGVRREIKAPVKAEEIDRADLIFISHEHFDHFEKDTVEKIVGRTGALVIAPNCVLRELSIPSSNKMEAVVGDEFVVKGVEVKVVQAIHPQSSCPVGYIIKKGGKSIYHAGDTYEFGGMFDIKVDYALLPVGGTYTMDIYSAYKAAKELNCRYIIPMHYNTHERIRQNMSEFAREIESNKVKPIIMKVGQRIEI